MEGKYFEASGLGMRVWASKASTASAFGMTLAGWRSEAEGRQGLGPVLESASLRVLLRDGVQQLSGGVAEIRESQWVVGDTRRAGSTKVEDLQATPPSRARGWKQPGLRDEVGVAR